MRPWFEWLSFTRSITSQSSPVPLIDHMQDLDQFITINRRFNGDLLFGRRLAKAFSSGIYCGVASKFLRLRCAERASVFARTRNMRML
ncbi:protein of unknown function [Methylocaldum szegediense]|uniref:Uncharacterized protein n=1 Tax=Methylocaldum szegediense TaxID=73780 RepID=A0ABM9I6H2_9GAMM|nr:protein of unknown function [Methylocaldum szegediense]